MITRKQNKVITLLFLITVLVFILLNNKLKFIGVIEINFSILIILGLSFNLRLLINAQKQTDITWTAFSPLSFILGVILMNFTQELWLQFIIFIPMLILCSFTGIGMVPWSINKRIVAD